MKARLFSISTAMWSPRRRPWANRYCASWFERVSSWAKVTASPVSAEIIPGLSGVRRAWSARQAMGRIEGRGLGDLENGFTHRQGSRQPQVFVGLHAQTPFRVGQAIGDGRLGRGGAVGAVHRLQEEAFEIEILKPGGVDALLR